MPPIAADRLRIGTLSVDDLIASARRETGLTEFGEPDVRAPLSALVESLNRESNLSPAGEAGRRAALLRALSNRLRLNDVLRRHPEIEDEVITKPVVVVGLQRSGTTKLQRVLAADPGMQRLPLWRLLQPVATEPAIAGQADPRIARAEAYVAAMRRNAPEMYAAHPMYAEEADEEVYVMELAFLANINATAYHAPSFDRWLAAQSFESWYVWFRRLLQYVQFSDRTQGRPWVLKAPHHMGFLPLLFRFFPDVTVVTTHRDPAVTVSSFASLAFAARRSNQLSADPAITGRYCLDYCAARTLAYLRDRAALAREGQFIDVSYRSVVSDVESVVHRVYATAGIELTPRALAAMRGWEREHEQHKHGSHRYAAQQFGLERGEIELAFAEYRRRFGDLC